MDEPINFHWTAGMVTAIASATGIVIGSFIAGLIKLRKFDLESINQVHKQVYDRLHLLIEESHKEISVLRMQVEDNNRRLLHLKEEHAMCEHKYNELSKQAQGMEAELRRLTMAVKPL